MDQAWPLHILQEKIVNQESGQTLSRKCDRQTDAGGSFRRREVQAVLPKCFHRDQAA